MRIAETRHPICNQKRIEEEVEERILAYVGLRDIRIQ